MKLTHKVNLLTEKQTIPKEQLDGHKFQVVKSDVKKLSKRKRPFELTIKFDMLQEKSGAFSFAYLTNIVATDDLYALEQDTPLSGRLVTVLRKVS